MQPAWPITEAQALTGHRMDLAGAGELTLALTPRYRLPETTRAADRACRDRIT